MKQHISIEQCKELDKLGFFEKYNIELESGTGLYSELCREVTIGKMIEILKTEYLINIVIDSSPDVILRSKSNGEAINIESEDELCDALFETVKHAMKN